MTGAQEVHVRLLGRFSIHCSGSEVPLNAFKGRLVQTFVRILVTQRGAFVSRDTLVEALWPGEHPADPAANLSVFANRARRALGDGSLILTGPGGYSFAADDRCRVDAEDLLAAVEAGRRHLAARHPKPALEAFEEAVHLWRGEALAEDAYGDWAQEYRTRVARAYLEALESGSVAALQAGDPVRAVALAERAVAREPLREATHLLFARALAASTDTAGALAAINRARQRFVEELGLDLSPEAAEIEARILRGEIHGVSTTATQESPCEPHDSGAGEAGEQAVALSPAQDLLEQAGRTDEAAAPWMPGEAEREAAWAMYVELVTRIGVQELQPGEGLLREALTSLYTLFEKTRQILHRYGPSVAAPSRGTMSFGLIAVTMLNRALRPVLATWHTELAHHESLRPPEVSPVDHERQWPRAQELRKALAGLQPILRNYANLLSKVAGVPPLTD